MHRSLQQQVECCLLIIPLLRLRFVRISSMDALLNAFDAASLVILNEHNRHCGCTLFCFVVESCDVFVGNRTLLEPFGNI